MKNKEVFEIFDQLSETKIERLIWIAAAGLPNRDIFDMITDILDSECADDVFPKGVFNNVDVDDLDKDYLSEILCDNRIFGFLAEVYVPEISDMQLKENGSARSWSTGGVSSIHYVYAETPDELVVKIKKISEDYFESCIKKSQQG